MSSRPAARIAGPLALSAVLALAGIALPAYRLLAVNQHVFLAVNVLALNFCLGLGGQISLAQAAFAGLGAYASVLAHAAFPQASVLIVPLVILATGLLAESMSESLFSTSMTTELSSSTDAVSSTKTVASSIGVMPTLTVAVVRPPWPSEMETVKESEPL